MIVEALKCVHINKEDLSAIAVSHGPGSYTGLRVGTSTAKGLAHSLGIPIVAIPTLTAIAYEISKSVDSVDCIMPTIDARRKEVYTAIYTKDLDVIKPAQAFIISDFSMQELASGCHQLVICGNGAEKCNDATKEIDHIQIAPTKCSASNLCLLAHEKLQKGGIEDLTSYVPFYLKQPNITKPKKPF